MYIDSGAIYGMYIMYTYYVYEGPYSDFYVSHFILYIFFGIYKYNLL